MIGITGSIGAGKSLVGRILRDHKFCVIDADAAVRDLYRDNNVLRTAIASEFGKDMLTEEGIDRKRMSDLVFSDDSCRKRLESLVYPVLTAYVLRENPAFVEAALFENVPDLVAHLREIWVVEASEEVCLKRLVENRGFSENDALRRISLQRGRSAADYWEKEFPGKTVRFIDNSADETRLAEIIKLLIEEI